MKKTEMTVHFKLWHWNDYGDLNPKKSNSRLNFG